MSDEASQILAMVGDGKITADEAAKLLKALNGQQGGGEETQKVKIIKMMGEGGAEMHHGHEHHGHHGHHEGCHCVSVSSDDGVNIWQERTSDV
ncbi:MAG: hypothetical protein HOB82_02230 [Alphaproteobacteria bacterium]|jgi:hypothetical protein|nr:hypothetical protein [Alphaproteobacteria bacterium]MBT4710330.1 hypothetical protein [Alphaproteobacteria bacterium]MBT5859879.1 hypothetical protein [Alphaproteobacteria bacterium]